MLPKNSPKVTASKNIAQDSLVGSYAQYDDEGQVVLGVVTGQKKEKYLIVNVRGRESELTRNRLYILPGKEPAGISSMTSRTQALVELANSIEAEASAFNVAELWSFLHEEPRLYSVSELCKSYFGSDTCVQHAGLRVALIRERIHFKRDKDAFEPRTASVVEELRKAEEAKARKKALREATLTFISERVNDKNIPIPGELHDAIDLLEEVAASVAHTDPARQKEAREFVHTCAERLRVPESLSIEKRAFEVLLKIGVFHEHTNLSFIRHTIPVTHTPEAVRESTEIQVPNDLALYPESERAIRRDLTRVRCFTIDDATTRDMDDALSVEQTQDGYEIGIHITDATLAVTPGTALDRAARRRATSIYCADQTVNMLPEELSEFKLSLTLGDVRPSLSVLVSVSPKFEILSSTVTPSFVKVTERYSYEQVDELLEGGDSSLLVLHDMAAAYEELRIRRGAMRVHKREVVPFYEEGQVRLQEIHEESPARILVSEMMVLANSIMATFAMENNIPVLYRGQERPDDVPQNNSGAVPDGPAKDFSVRSKLKKSSVSLDPQPHAGLGLDAYIQATSPIRRYMDLCHQRQFISFFRAGRSWATREEFDHIASEIENYLQAATLCSRETRRYWLLRYLEQRGRNKPIEATVVRTDLKSPLVELDEVYMTTLVRLRSPVKLGDRVTLKISAVDAHADYLRLM